MFKFWNNFCGMALLFLTFSFRTEAQFIDSTAKPSHLLPVSVTYDALLLTKPTFFFTQENRIHINWGSPFSHWGIFCIGEYKLSKKTGIPLYFRLGSLEYVNKLEGKK